ALTHSEVSRDQCTRGTLVTTCKSIDFAYKWRSHLSRSAVTLPPPTAPQRFVARPGRVIIHASTRFHHRNTDGPGALRSSNRVCACQSHGQRHQRISTPYGS